ncbi:MAG: T9SS type A sorting domain-containing protein [Ignavibacteria bacterium]|jgi:photosystem II stability/assembly factor-like uncharacterized protein
MKKFTILLSVLFIIFSSNNNSSAQVFWNEVASGVTVSLNSVSNVNGSVAWACGQNGTVIKTVNGGYNWINVSGNGIPNVINLVNIYAVDANIALTSGNFGITTSYIYRTSNGGSNWTQVFTQNNGYINAIWMTTSAIGFMEGNPVGGRWSLWKTSNGGINWDSTGLYLSQTATETGWNNSMWIDTNKIWFGTNNSKLYYSTNFGSAWTFQSISPETNSYMICFDRPIVMYGLTGGQTLYRTTNRGLNWLNVTISGTGNFIGAAIDMNIYNCAWVIRNSNTIYRSYLPYTNWMTDYTAPAGNYTHMSMSRQVIIGSGVIYAVRSNGGISRGNGTFEGVRILSSEIPASFNLYQNYPNPFNPQTHFKFEIPYLKNNNPGEILGSQIVIKVYDVMGRVVETLLDQVTKPGIYETSWDGSKYSSGIYFYQVYVKDPRFVNSEPEHIATKKMVLIK